jgi:hypothetical protein|tara:strand:+ start:316 stop:522 length:207 start_codon:yes stop_codon:yes gene_type:complete
MTKSKLVKVRLQCEDDREIDRVAEILLQRCPELILASARLGSNPKYAGQQKYARYGDFKINVIRKRRS